MFRLGTLFLFSTAAFATILNSNAVNPALFNVTTFASGLQFPASVLPVAGGNLLVETSPGFGSAPGQLLDFGPGGGTGAVVYNSLPSGLMTGLVQVGNYYAVGNDGSRLGPTGDHSITLVQPGPTPSSPVTTAATLTLNYAQPWEHDNVGMAVRPTPGVPGSYDLILNIGAQGDNTATPASQQVTLTGTGFSSIPSQSLSGDSLYLIRIDETGTQLAITDIQQVATGIRNVFGIAFDPATGDLYFADNGIDTLPPGSTLTPAPDGEPPQADELNVLPGATLGTGPPPNYGFPDCYIRYAYGGIQPVAVGSGCVQPLAAFQPITDAAGTHELEGPTSLAFAPPDFPAPFNDGIFIAFTGGESPNDEAGMAYYDFATHQYIHFIESLNGQTGSLIGLTSTDNALFVTDVNTGEVYEIASATPEPPTSVIFLVLSLTAALLASRARFTSSKEGSKIVPDHGQMAGRSNV
ncbi:MAG TPA: hypothetical protein VKB88_08110 [Bryobacteraceae bacterium]|nr:hypothetical protein [Bryobacteraceae bacterium]